MQVTENYYTILNVSPDADKADIRAAYRALMRRYHPDVNASADAAAKAKAINEAYACLRDASKRATYDWQGTAEPIVSQSSATPSRPSRPRPVWDGPAQRAEPRMPWYRPTWGKAAGLGAAAVVTSITFAATSAVPPVTAAPVEVTMHVSVKPVEASAVKAKMSDMRKR